MADRDLPQPDAFCDPPNLSTLWGRVLIDELARCGVRHAVIAPGSRSTPLAFAAADHPDVSDLSVIDERSAAFVALGLARATGWPALVISTSGTAATNFLPAVTEADRAGVPLLVLTADRPARLRDAGDSQTADQVKLFGSRVRWFHETPHPGLGPGAGEATLRALRSAAAHAWARAAGSGGPPGPVHLNVPLDKPLEPRPAAPGEPGALPGGFDPAGAAAGRPGGAPWLRPVPTPLGTPHTPDPATVERLALALAAARRPLVLAGATASAGVPGVSERLRHAVARLAERLALPVWAEATSGLRLAHETGDRVIGTGELLLASVRFRERLTGGGPGGADLVLRLGEAPIGWGGRRLAAELATAGVLQIAVDPWGRCHDPDHGVAWAVAAEPGALLGAVADLLERRDVAGAAEGSWIALHRDADRAARAGLAEEAARRPELFDGGVFWHLGSLLPDDAALVVSSSMPLREVEMFLPAAPAEGEGLGRTGRTVDLFANRGLNGIDGVTSTALGVALGRWVDPGAGRAEGGSRTVLVTGDVAFAHDLSGALAAGRLQGARADLTVVLVNNDGGAIFDHLPAAGREPAFTRHLATPTGADFAALARGCGLEHRAPGDWKGFRATIADALATPGCRVVEVRTDRTRSKAIREEIAAAVAAAVDRTLGKPAAREPATAVAAGGERSRAERPEPARPGPPGHPGGAPLVLLHGFTGSAADWQAWPPRVAWHPGGDHLGALFGRPALTLDLPGHGTSPGAGGATMDAAVEEILAALDRRGIDRAHLVGYSMGGRAAVAFAAGHPDRLASLVLIGASPGIEDDAERSERRRQDEALARELDEPDAGGDLEGFVDRWMALPLFATQALLGHRHLRLARLRRLAGSSRGYAASLRGMGQGAQPSYWPALQAIETPTLLLAGGRDEKYVRLAHRMAEAMPHARVEIVPGVGHAAHLEAPDTVAEAIREHVEGIDRGDRHG